MKYKVFVYILFFSILCGYNLAFACLTTEKEKQDLFKEFDIDKDGKVSLEEYLMVEGKRVYGDRGKPIDKDFLTKRYFENMDTERKGYIEIDKFSPISLKKCK
jgi:Ca2+-binding EF-hand superfamily protein